MRRFSIALVMAAALAGSPAWALDCVTDLYGNPICRLSSGEIVRGRAGEVRAPHVPGIDLESGRPDMPASTTVSDGIGNAVASGPDDGFGNTTIRDASGATVRASSDSLGNRTLHRVDGTTIRCRIDSFGNAICG